MKILLLACLMLFSSIIVKASEIRIIEINQTTLYYHFCKSVKPSKKLLFFLHGSISVFKGQTESKPKDLNELLEFNKDFIQTFEQKGYDIIIPIAYNEYNWLEKKGELFIDSLYKSFNENYSEIYMSGFSDGATGAFKYFYNQPNKYKGLLLFNGFPQHNNYYKNVDYKKIFDHKILFIAQKHDKVVPYEFMLTEYRRQKITNSETYFMLLEGKHNFDTYRDLDFENCIKLLEASPTIIKISSDSLWIYPPVDGFMLENKLIETYPFRSSIARKFGMKKSEYKTNLTQTQKILKLSKQNNLVIMPLKIGHTDLQKSSFEFTYIKDGKEGLIIIQNYLRNHAW